MCRLAAYLGPELPLQQLLDEPPNSLIKQSWASEELQGTTLNADGFGFGWYLANAEPAVYTSTLPIWADSNLPGLGKTLRFPLWLAYVRSATPGQATNQANTQPFRDGRLLFIHNGRIEAFNHGPRAALHGHLAADIAAGIQGNSDSEYLFALYRQYAAGGLSVQAALTRAANELQTLLPDTPALLNMVISDGEALYACRHAINGGQCPSLYYTDSHPAFPNAVVIASERFSRPECWQAVTGHSLLVVGPDKSITPIAL